MRKILLLALFAFVLQHAKSQSISISGQIAYANPMGEAFTFDENSSSTKFGLGGAGDLLYFHEKFEEKLGLGIAYNEAIVFGASASDDTVDVGLYGIQVYGLKGYYKFFDTKVTPYACLIVGLAGLEVPQITSGSDLLFEGKRTYNLGVQPEIGLQMGAFSLSASYLVPMKYETFKTEKQTASYLQFMMGYRHYFEL